MKKYSKMSDVFKSELFIDGDCDDVIVDDLSLTVLESFSGSDAAKFALHAINSHDELVEMNKELLAALECAEGFVSEVSEKTGFGQVHTLKVIRSAIAKAKAKS